MKPFVMQLKAHNATKVFLCRYSLATSMTLSPKCSQVFLFRAYVEIHQVRRLVFDTPIVSIAFKRVRRYFTLQQIDTIDCRSIRLSL